MVLLCLCTGAWTTIGWRAPSRENSPCSPTSKSCKRKTFQELAGCRLFQFFILMLIDACSLTAQWCLFQRSVRDDPNRWPFPHFPVPEVRSRKDQPIFLHSLQFLIRHLVTAPDKWLQPNIYNIYILKIMVKSASWRWPLFSVEMTAHCLSVEGTLSWWTAFLSVPFFHVASFSPSENHRQHYASLLAAILKIRFFVHNVRRRYGGIFERFVGIITQIVDFGAGLNWVPIPSFQLRKQQQAQRTGATGAGAVRFWVLVCVD